MILTLKRRIVRVLRISGRLSKKMGMTAPVSGNSFVCQLYTTQADRSLFDEINTYNRIRSEESRKPIYDSNRVLLFHYVLNKIKSLEEGDYAEVGTYRGLTASLVWKAMAEGTSLYCFDTFEGFASTDLKKEEDTLNIDVERGKFKNTDLQTVEQTIAGGSNPRLKLIKGYFPDSFAGYEDKTFRFVHLDVDLAQPIAAGLDIFWLRLVPGGAILIHDYLSPKYPGVKKATDDFFDAIGIPVLPWCDRLGTAVILKDLRDKQKAN